MKIEIHDNVYLHIICESYAENAWMEKWQNIFNGTNDTGFVQYPGLMITNFVKNEYTENLINDLAGSND